MPKGVFARPSVADRFWKKVDKSGDCWLWMGLRFRSGYGMISVEGRSAVTHRVAWSLANGPIANGMFVLHSCDVRHCVNPAHLFLGTHADNMRDMTNKGRQAAGLRSGRYTMPESNPRGERHGRAVVSDAAVDAMRRQYRDGEHNHGVLAAIFGCSRSQVWRIVSGQQRVTHQSGRHD